MWAFARAGPRHCPLLQRIADTAMRRSFEPLHISSLVWAFASVGRSKELDECVEGFRHEPLFTSIAVAMRNRGPSESHAQYNASVLWAFASCSMTRGCGTVSQTLCLSILAAKQGYTPRHVANMLWALATSRRHCDGTSEQRKQQRSREGREMSRDPPIRAPKTHSRQFQHHKPQAASTRHKPQYMHITSHMSLSTPRTTNHQPQATTRHATIHTKSCTPQAIRQEPPVHNPTKRRASMSRQHLCDNVACHPGFIRNIIAHPNVTTGLR